jgi:putative ABC transport system permease protein
MPLTEEDVSVIRRQVHGIVLAAPLVSSQLPLVAGDHNWRTLVAGSDNDYLAARDWSLRLGRFFSNDEIRAAAKVAIIGSVVSRSLFGDAVAVGSSFRIGHIPFTVVGVLDDKGLGSAGRSQDDVVFIPITTAESRIFGALHGATRTALDFITIKVSDPASLSEVKADVEDLLRTRHRLRAGAPSDFRFSDPSELLAARAASVRSLNLLLLAVACISLVVGGISVLNVMIVSVTERTREIGLRMAIGARRGDIRNQFLIEALILALAGGLLGSLIGSAAAIAIGLSAGWPILLNPLSILLAWGIAGTTGIVFGLYPAQRASALDPITALRFE